MGKFLILKVGIKLQILHILVVIKIKLKKIHSSYSLTEGISDKIYNNIIDKALKNYQNWMNG